MKRLFCIFFFVTVLFSCVNNKTEYVKNLDHFKNLIEDINTYFIDSTLENLEISNYYTEDFVFHSYPAGYKKGIETSKVDYIEGFIQMNKINMNQCN